MLPALLTCASILLLGKINPRTAPQHTNVYNGMA
jgi:hypothetical protein